MDESSREPRREATIHDAVIHEDPSRWPEGREPVARPVAPGAPRPVTAPTAPTPPPRAYAEPPVRRPMFSIGATFLGWSVAAFFTVVFTTIAFAFVGGEAMDGAVTLDSVATASFASYLVAVFLAFLIGGYAAGRIALWRGTWHGLGTVGWSVLAAILAAIVGVYVAPDLLATMPLQVSVEGNVGILALAIALAVMLLGAGLGGRLGERYHLARADRERRAVRGGRPL